MSGDHKQLYGSDPALLGAWAARLARKDKLKWVIAVTVAFGALLELIDTSIVNVALPDIQGNLGATLSEVGWVSTGYSCANVIIIPLSAWLGYRFGKKNYLVFSLLGFTGASMLCGMSGSLVTLVLARVLQGLCGGGLLAKAQSVLFETFPREEQPVAQSLFGIAIICGPALGPVLGGYLTDNLGWRWIFFINLPVGILAVAMSLIFLPEDKEDDLRVNAPVDWLGIGLLTVGLACLQTMLEEGHEHDWFGSRFITTMAVGSTLGLAAFVWRELVTRHPAVDLRVLRYRSVVAGSAYSMILGMGIYGIMFAVPVFVQNYLHFNATQSGILQMPGALASAVMMLVLGRFFSGRVDARVLVATGALVTVATCLLLREMNPDTGTQSLFWPLILRGAGSVLMFLPLALATLGGIPKRDVAAASGFFNLTRQLGSSVGIAVLTTLLARQESVHRAALVEKVTLFQYKTLSRIDVMTSVFGAHGGDPVASKHRALITLDRIIDSQSALLAFGDMFFYVAIIFFVSLPLVLLLGAGKKQDPAIAAH